MSEEKKLTGYPSIDKPWLKYYSEEAINAPLPKCTIYEYLWENNRGYPNDIAILYFNKKVTYGEFFRNIDKTAAALIAVGVKQGDIVTVALPSIPEALYAVYALNKIGAVANMIHPLAGEQEILNYLNEVKSKVCLIYTGTYEIIKKSLSKTNVKIAIIISPTESLSTIVKGINKIKSKEQKIKISTNLMNWKSFIKKGKGISIKPISKSCYDMAIISHTGGTTGEPKGVMLSDYNINSVIWQISCDMVFNRQEINMAVLPPFVNYSLVDGMFAPLAFGFKLVLIPDYKPEKIDVYIKKYSPNHLMASIPPYYEAMLKNKKLLKMDLSCLKHIYYGGDKMNDRIENDINTFLLSHKAKFPLAKGLGSTEMTSAVTVTFESINLPNSSGIPLVKNNIKVVEPDTVKELSYNSEGEICMSGPSLMIGYYNNQKATESLINVHDDGTHWIHTGDLGFISEQGAVFLTGRIKRIILTKGKDGNTTKIFPERIEKVISQHPAVEICCVIGVKDDLRIHYPKAFIVLNSGYDDTEMLKEEICNFCKDKLPEYMIPEVMEFKTDLPLTNRGKIDYRALENMAN